MPDAARKRLSRPPLDSGTERPEKQAAAARWPSQLTSISLGCGLPVPRLSSLLAFARVPGRPDEDVRCLSRRRRRPVDQSVEPKKSAVGIPAARALPREG